MKLTMSTPCLDCPFRRGNWLRLPRALAADIAGSLRHGGSFPCHKTTDLSESPDLLTSTQCAGAEVFSLLCGWATSGWRQVAGRIFDVKIAALDMDADVYQSLEEFLDDQHA